MMARRAIRTDGMRDRIAAYAFPRGGVEVVCASRGYTLYSRRTDGPVARLRPTGEGDEVQVCDSEGRLGPLLATSAPLSCRSIRPSSLARRKTSSGSMPDAYNLPKYVKSSSGLIREQL
jgi:hypothetical protein